MSYEKILKEDARLVMLMHFQAQNDRTLDQHLLQRLLKASGRSLSMDKIRTELAWLKEQSLIRYEENDGALVATILLRGEEVAQGVVTVPGVQRPSASED